MKNFKNVIAVSILFVAFTFGACSQDENMDEIIDNTEINAPAPSGNGSDDPTGSNPTNG